MACILGIIPARGGSKGIPEKNIVDLVDKPLIAYTIQAVSGSKLLSDVILSTDSEKIADISKKYGLKCDRLRPNSLGRDDARSADVAVYEVNRYEEENNIKVDIIVLLQPTAPLRTSEDIDQAIELFQKTDHSSVVSVADASAHHPVTMYYHEDGHLNPVVGGGRKHIRRQDFPPVYIRNGALYIIARDQLFTTNSFLEGRIVPFLMPAERSVNIDSPMDLEIARCIIKRFFE